VEILAMVAKSKKSHFFGEGKESIEQKDVNSALSIKNRLDISILTLLILFMIGGYYGI
jgi:hypothetical protein